MLSEALGRLDVNTVCPLPASWINYVLFTFSYSPRNSHVSYMNLFILVRFFAYAVQLGGRQLLR